MNWICLTIIFHKATYKKVRLFHYNLKRNVSISFSFLSLKIHFVLAVILCQFFQRHLGPPWHMPSINLYITCCPDCTTRMLHWPIPAKPSLSQNEVKVIKLKLQCMKFRIKPLASCISKLTRIYFKITSHDGLSFQAKVCARSTG